LKYSVVSSSIHSLLSELAFADTLLFS